MSLLQGVSMKERLQEKEHTARLISFTTFSSLVHPQTSIVWWRTHIQRNARRYKRLLSYGRQQRCYACVRERAPQWPSGTARVPSAAAPLQTASWRSPCWHSTWTRRFGSNPAPKGRHSDRKSVKATERARVHALRIYIQVERHRV